MGVNISKQSIINDISNSISIKSKYDSYTSQTASTDNIIVAVTSQNVEFIGTCKGKLVVTNEVNVQVINTTKNTQQTMSDIKTDLQTQMNTVLDSVLKQIDEKNLAIPIKDIGLSIGIQDVNNTVRNAVNESMETVCKTENLTSIFNNVAQYTDQKVKIYADVFGDCDISNKGYVNVINKLLSSQLSSQLSSNTSMNKLSTAVSTEETNAAKNAWVELALIGGVVTVVIAIIGAIFMMMGGKDKLPPQYGGPRPPYGPYQPIHPPPFQQQQYQQQPYQQQPYQQQQYQQPYQQQPYQQPQQRIPQMMQSLGQKYFPAQQAPVVYGPEPAPTGYVAPQSV